MNFGNSFENDLELQVELEFGIVEVVCELRMGRADGEVEVGHGKSDFLGALGVGESVGV